MEPTHALSSNTTLADQATGAASRSGLLGQGDEAGDKVAGAADVDMPQDRIQLNLFGEALLAEQSTARPKISSRRRSPQGTSTIQVLPILASEVAEGDLESARQTTTLFAISDAPTIPPAAATPREQAPNSDTDAQVDPQSASLWNLVPTFYLRGDDFKIESFASLIEPRPNDLKIYGALLRLTGDQQEGTQIDDETWRIRIGYSKICEESGCCKRALGRAWPRLERLGVVVCIKKHMDRRENLYLVRAPEWLERMYKEARCTHYRVLPKGMIQPFRPRSEGEK